MGNRNNMDAFEDNEAMDDLEFDGEELPSMEDLLNEYEESFGKFAEGEVVKGRIIAVDREYVLVDVGYKSEGMIPVHEFKNDAGEVTASVGDDVEVMIELWDEEEERVVLSKEKAEKIKVWEEIKKIYDEDGVVEGMITNRVKGGFSVDIGLQAFLPGSQADLRPVRNLDELVARALTSRYLSSTASGAILFFPAGFFWKMPEKEPVPRRFLLWKKARSWTVWSRTSPSMVCLWIWAVWTDSFISPISPGAA